MDGNADSLDAIRALNTQPFKNPPPNGYRAAGFELDKIPGWWVISHWPPGNEGVTLRLRVLHPSCDSNLTTFVCEVCIKPNVQFIEVAKGDRLRLYEIGRPHEHEEVAREMFLLLPTEWRSEFWRMARRFSAILYFVEFGSTLFERYADANESRRSDE